MSRNDREDVEFLNLPDPEPTIANYYMAEGLVLDRDEFEQTQCPLRICAKEIQNKETKITTYFVLCNNRNQMFDPRDTDARYQIRNVWKFRRVMRSTFDLYVKFLKQKYTSMLTQAERGL